MLEMDVTKRARKRVDFMIVWVLWEMKHTSSKDKLVPRCLWLLDLNLQGGVVDLTEADCAVDLGHLWRTLIGFQGIRQSSVQ
jgi:hypothetical protein